MTCVHCRGEMAWQTAPLHVDREGCHVVLDAVPAWVCQQCGEPYFEEREVDAIQTLIRSVAESARKIAATA
jgi:YgiT-type zinc finger domain-containing protein